MKFANATNINRKSGVAERRDLRFRGPFVEMFFDRAKRSGEICGFFSSLPRLFVHLHGPD
jgi:hypothetical protein